MLKRLSYIILFALIFSVRLCAQSKDSTVSIDEVPPYNELFDAQKDADRSPVIARAANEKLADSLRNSDDFWYVKWPYAKKKKKQPKPDERFVPASPIKVGLWIVLIGGFLAVLIWFLVSGDGRIFRKTTKKNLPAEDIEENIFEIDYNAAIHKAVNEKDFRLATRLGYLQLLKGMADRNLIRYSKQLTNSDYVSQLYGSNHYDDFFRITRHFEYAWYGVFDITAERYEKIREDQERFKSSFT